MPKRNATAIEITEILTLEYYSLKKTFSGDIKLNTGKNEKIEPVIGGNGTSKVDIKNPLTKIIQEINLKFGTNFTNKEKVLEKIVEAFKADKKAVNCAKENSPAMFKKIIYDKKFYDVCIDSISQDEDLQKTITADMELAETLKEELFGFIYDNLR